MTTTVADADTLEYLAWRESLTAIEWRRAFKIGPHSTVEVFRGYHQDRRLPVEKYFFCNGLRLFYLDGDFVAKRTEAALIKCLRRTM